MPKIRQLSGKDIITIFAKFGFSVATQRGSHVKLSRKVENRTQSLTIPNHKTLDKGTARAIFIQACRFISEEDIRDHFYTD